MKKLYNKKRIVKTLSMGLFFQICFIIACAPFLLTNCGYALKYKLNDKKIYKSSFTIPLKIQVATFSDNRDAIEKNNSARKAQGFPNAGDYTNDKNFKGNVAESVSKMLTEHLAYSGIFTEVTSSPHRSEQINNNILNQIRNDGYDAVLVGDIQHFSGFYDHRVGRQIFYALGLGLGIGIPVGFATISQDDLLRGQNSIEGQIATGVGVSLGFYLESLHKRDIEKHTTLDVRLVSTSTYDEIWSDSFEIHQKEHTSMPGLNSSYRQMELAVTSLRETVNEMVRSLSQSNLFS